MFDWKKIRFKKNFWSEKIFGPKNLGRPPPFEKKVAKIIDFSFYPFPKSAYQISDP